MIVKKHAVGVTLIHEKNEVARKKWEVINSASWVSQGCDSHPGVIERYGSNVS